MRLSGEASLDSAFGLTLISVSGIVVVGVEVVLLALPRGIDERSEYFQ